MGNVQVLEELWRISPVPRADAIDSENFRLFHVPSRVHPRLRVPTCDRPMAVLERQNSEENSENEVGLLEPGD